MMPATMRACLRQLRGFTESSGIPWGHVVLRIQRDEDGFPVEDDPYLDALVRHGGRTVEVYVRVPSRDRNDTFQGQLLPRGRLAARFEDKRVVKGDLDQITWDLIAKEIFSESPMPLGPSPVEAEQPAETAAPLEEKWDESGRRIADQPRRSAFAHCRPESPRGSGWA